MKRKLAPDFPYRIPVGEIRGQSGVCGNQPFPYIPNLWRPSSSRTKNVAGKLRRYIYHHAAQQIVGHQVSKLRRYFSSSALALAITSWAM